PNLSEQCYLQALSALGLASLRMVEPIVTSAFGPRLGHEMCPNADASPHEWDLVTRSCHSLWGRRGFSPRLQRGVHLLEAEPGLAEHRLQRADEEAAEALGLNETAAVFGEGFDAQAVLAVYKPGDDEATEPAQLMFRLGG